MNAMRATLVTMLVILAALPARADPTPVSLDAVEFPEAEASPAGPLARLLSEAYRNNPAIQQSRAAAERTRSGAEASGTLPNPMLMTMFMLMPGADTADPKLSVSLSQKFPFLGTLRLEKQMAARMADAMSIMADARVRDVLVEVKSLYFELHYLQRALEIIRVNRELARHIAELGTAAFGKNEVPWFDWSRARAELARTEYDEAVIADQLSMQWKRLAALLGREEPGVMPDIPSLSFLAPAVPLDGVERLALDRRQELAASGLDEEAAEAGVALARKGYWPEFEVGATWVLNEMQGPMGSSDGFGVTLGVGLPVWRDSIAARIDEAKAARREAGFRRRDIAARTRSEAAGRVYAVVTSARLVKLYSQSLMPQARAAIESAEQEGMTDMTTVGVLLERRAYLLQIELSYQRALADYYKAIARLEQVMGSPMPLKPQEGAISNASMDIAAATQHLSEQVRSFESNLPGPAAAGNVSTGTEGWKEAGKALGKGVKAALGGPLTIALVERATLAGNRSIRQADAELEAAIRILPQVAHLDNILVQYADISAGVKMLPDRMSPGPMVKEGYPFPSLLAIKSEMARLDVEMASQNAGLARRNAITEVRMAYAELWFATSAAGMLSDLLEPARQLAALVRERISTGGASVADALRAEMLVAGLQTRLETFGDMRRKAEASIATLAGLPADTKLGSAAEQPQDTLPESWERKVRSAAERRHEIRAMDLAIRRMELAIRLQKGALHGGLSSGLSEPADLLAPSGDMAFPEQPMKATDVYLAGTQAYVAEMEKRLEALRQERRSMADEIAGDAVRKLEDLRSALRAERLHSRELAPRSQQALNLLLASYSVGGGAFQELLEVWQETVMHRLDEAEAVRDAAMARARLQDSAVFE